MRSLVVLHSPIPVSWTRALSLLLGCKREDGTCRRRKTVQMAWMIWYSFPYKIWLKKALKSATGRRANNFPVYYGKELSTWLLQSSKHAKGIWAGCWCWFCYFLLRSHLNKEGINCIWKKCEHERILKDQNPKAQYKESASVKGACY